MPTAVLDLKFPEMNNPLPFQGATPPPEVFWTFSTSTSFEQATQLHDWDRLGPAIAAEAVLRRFWDRPEEDEACRDL